MIRGMPATHQATRPQRPVADHRGATTDGAPPPRRRGPRPEPPLLSVKRLLLRFVLTGLAAMIVLATVTAVVSRQVGTAEAIDEAERIGAIAGRGVVEPALALNPGVLDGDPAALAAFDRRMRETLIQGSLVRMKIWTADGRIIYSDESRLIGERFELDEDAEVALTGEVPQAHVSSLSGAENRFETAGSRLLEVYSLIEGPGGEPLLFEPYFSYSAVTESGRRIWLSFAPVVLGALLVLQLMQFPLAWSMAHSLRRGQRERERLLRHAIDSSDGERRRIAGDLHDGTVQDLAGVSLELSAAARRAASAGERVAPEAGPEVFQDAARRVRGAITSLRSLLVEIYPPNLEKEGLEQALSDMLGRLPAKGMESHLDVSLPDAPLDAETTALIYRCAQEIVRNAVRHASARGVWLRVNTLDDVIVLEVSDDGRGFDPRAGEDAQAAGHVGLRVLADLVADSGGTVELASAPGRGTHVRVEVPR